MGLTYTGTNRRYWEQRDKAREIVERLARDAEECGNIVSLTSLKMISRYCVLH